ncbi:hypothetical protein GRJ2_002545800 [Grus japonensis]|uniref:Uncharacterized protein n=1 Tax=Grus japonensis TaxID=30415 RepID=A0ABC9XSX9_GRUJA
MRSKQQKKDFFHLPYEGSDACANGARASGLIWTEAARCCRPPCLRARTATQRAEEPAVFGCSMLEFSFSM